MRKPTQSSEINAFWGKHNQIKKLKGSLSLSALGEKMSMDQGGVSKIIQGSVNVYLHRIVEIAQILGCKPSELLPLEWQKSDTGSFLSKETVSTVIETVEEWLLGNKLTLKPAEKAKLIVLLCAEVSALPQTEQESKIIEFSNFYLKSKSA
jgi:transcriptional regulator with XRE-family HTH domain